MADNEPTKWDYKYTPAGVIEELKKDGEQGWEATGILTNSGVLMKRPKKTQTQQKAPEPYPSYSR